MAEKLQVLFLCTGNSCRSQMAEGWARHLKGGRIEPHSAGTEARGLDPRAVKAMAEAGVDISRHRSKNVADLLDVPFDYVVTVCSSAQEACPVFPGRAKVTHVGFDDPPALARSARTEEEALAHYRRVRDEIRGFVETLPEALTRPAGTDRLGRPPGGGRVSALIQRLLPPPILFVLCLGGMGLLRWAWPIAVWLRPPCTWLGVILVLGGLGLGLVGVWRFRKHRTRILPFRKAKRLVRDGIYRHTRNPMYLGDVLMLLGVWIILGAVSPAGPVVVFAVLADRWFIPAEEEMVRRTFGREFEDYCRRTRRWF